MKKILKLHKDMQLFIVFGGYMRNSKGRDGYVNKTLSAAERTFLRRYAGTGSLTEALAKSGGLGADGLGGAFGTSGSEAVSCKMPAKSAEAKNPECKVRSGKDGFRERKRRGEAVRKGRTPIPGGAFWA